jgi:TolB-like protein/Tfp pilus assembly protein PilF
LYWSRSKNIAPIESIAVMPFVNESGNADVEYLSDGMTETLIASLSQLPNLSVKARSTVFYYKGKEASPKKIGAELDVQAVLLGRVAQRGNDIKLNLELVNTSTQDVIWSEQYNRKQSELLTLQGDIARDVSSKLKTKLSGAEVAKLTKTYTANPAAYELYLQGKYYANRYTKEGLGQSIDCFNQAVAIDPNYSSAYSGLAYTYILMDDWFMSPNESAPKAREAARKALEINESDVDAHVVLGLVAHWYDWDWSVAEKEFKRSLELNPRNPESYLYYSYLLSPLGRPAEAEAIARQGLQVDPLSSGTNFGVASALVFDRRWDEAIVHLRKSIELDPNYWFHHSYLGRAYEQKGMMPEAIAEFKLAFALDNQQSENWAGLAHAYAVSGRKDEAQKMLNDLTRKASEKNYVSPYSVAVIYAGLEDKDKSFLWLERAYSERSYYLPVYLTTDARLDWLHSDPRFKDLVRRIGLPELK